MRDIKSQVDSGAASQAAGARLVSALTDVAGPLEQPFSLRSGSARLSASAVCANEPLLRTWRGDSCLQRRDSSRRRCVGHASDCPVERSSTRSEYFSHLVFPAIETALPEKFAGYRNGGLKGRLQAGLPATRKAKGEQRASAGLETGQPAKTKEFLWLRLVQASCSKTREVRQILREPARAGRRLDACPTQRAHTPVLSRLFLVFSLSLCASVARSQTAEGIAAFNRGDYQAARTTLEKSPNDARARLFLAHSKAATGECEAAIPELLFPQSALGRQSTPCRARSRAMPHRRQAIPGSRRDCRAA